MSQLTGSHSRRVHPPRAWPPQIRIAVVVAACLIVEAVVAKNVIDVKLNFVAQLAPLWVYAALLAWTTTDRVSEVATMILALGVTVGVLVFYAL